MWCWIRLWRVPWTARRPKQSILKEISPEYSLEGLMLKLKLQYFGHLMWRADSLEETLMLEKIEGRRKKGMTEDAIVGCPSLIWWTWIWASSGSWWWTEKPGVLQSMGCKESDMTEQLNWLVRYFVEYFNWHLYNVCLMINLELWVLWKKTTEIKFSPYSALSEMS